MGALLGVNPAPDSHGPAPSWACNTRPTRQTLMDQRTTGILKVGKVGTARPGVIRLRQQCTQQTLQRQPHGCLKAALAMTAGMSTGIRRNHRAVAAGTMQSNPRPKNVFEPAGVANAPTQLKLAETQHERTTSLKELSPWILRKHCDVFERIRTQKIGISGTRVLAIRRRGGYHCD